MKNSLVVFLSVFLAELGDKTQFAILLFATNPAAGKISVFLAAAAALVASTFLAVLAGGRVSTWVSPEHLRVGAGLGFVAIGLWMLFGRS